MVEIYVSLTGALAQVAEKDTTVEADTLFQALNALTEKYGEDFGKRLFDGNGKPRRFINIYLNGRDYRFLKQLDTELSSNDELSLIPAVSGG
jgi:molybdopterin synthase sulfur carrier subunit